MIYAYTRPRYQVSVYRTIGPLVYVKGDSGGPNGCYDNNGDFYLVGVTSWSPKPNGICGEYANVYMRVSKYLRWIKYFSYSPDRQSQTRTGIDEQGSSSSAAVLGKVIISFFFHFKFRKFE